jgi:hypothetical protein
MFARGMEKKRFRDSSACGAQQGLSAPRGPYATASSPEGLILNSTSVYSPM